MFLKRFFNFIPRNEYSRALDLFNEGHYRRALRIFEDLLANHRAGDDLDVGTVELFACESHVALSRDRLSEGDTAEALREMEIAVGLKPNFADLRFALGDLYMDHERHVDAKEQFCRALDINPRYFKAGVNLARAEWSAGTSDKAIARLEDQKTNCPNFCRDTLNKLIQMIRVNQEAEAIRGNFREILNERPSSAQISREVAIEAIQNGNYTEAIRELKKAIALKPDYPDLHNYLGIAYGNKGMSDDAIEEFETALKINPYYLKARLNLALALYDCGRYVEAQNHIERVLSVKPDNQLAKNLLDELKAVTDRK